MTLFDLYLNVLLDRVDGLAIMAREIYIMRRTYRGSAMNKIQAKHTSSFNHEVLSIFIDDQLLCDYLSTTTSNPDLEDLWCAWLLADSQQTWDYIWSLIENK